MTMTYIRDNLNPSLMKPIISPEEQPLSPEVQERFQQLRHQGRPVDDPGAIRRILVRAPNWVGDAVMSLPVPAGLTRLFPRAEITVLAAPRVAQLFKGQPGVVDIRVYPRGRGKCSLLRSLRGRFGLALALPNSLESALGLWVAGAPHRVGYNADARRPFLTLALEGRGRLAGLHLVYYYLGLLQAFGEVRTFTPPTLFLGPEELTAAAELLEGADLPESGPWVGLSPGAAYGPAKRWPPERFGELAAQLQDEFQARIVLLGGPEDREAAAGVQALMSRPPLDLVGRTTLRQALGVLSQLKALVTNDSGLMHVAAALGTPLTALFGSTDPGATGPFTNRATIIRHPLDCSPCFKRTCKEDYPCLTAINVAEVMAAVRGWLKEHP